MTSWEIMRDVSQGVITVPNASLHAEGGLLEKSSGLSHPLTHAASGKFRKEIEHVLSSPCLSSTLGVSCSGEAQVLLCSSVSYVSRDNLWDRGCQPQPNTP